MPNISWKDFKKFMEKDDTMKAFMEAWKRNHKIVLLVERDREKMSGTDYQTSLRGALKGRLPYDNEVRIRIGQLFTQFLYETFVQEAGDEVANQIADELIGGKKVDKSRC